MTPTYFPQANTQLQRSTDDDSAGHIPAHTDRTTVLSCWRLSWRERLAAVFTGRLWLWVRSGDTQPPVAMKIGGSPFDETDNTGN